VDGLEVGCVALLGLVLVLSVRVEGCCRSGAECWVLDTGSRVAREHWEVFLYGTAVLIACSIGTLH